MIKKLVISTVNHNQMVHFYSVLLRLTFQDIPVGGMKISVAEQDGFALMLCPSAISGVVTDMNNVQPTFVVGQVIAARERGLAAGGSPISEAATADNEAQTWDIRDPDGNSIELFAYTT